MGKDWKSEELKLVRRNPYWMALFASPYLVGIALIIGAFVTKSAPIALPSVHAAIFGTIGAWWAYKRNRDPRHEAGETSVEADGVYFTRPGGERQKLISRKDLKQGFVLDERGTTIVRLISRKRLSLAVEFAVPTAAHGRELLMSLGLDATQTVAEMRVASRLIAQPVGKQMAYIFGGMGVLFAGQIAFALLHVPAAMGAWGGFMGLLMALVAMRTTRLRIGGDGISMKWLGREQFFHYSTIARVDHLQKGMGTKQYVGIEFTLHTGETVWIPAGQAKWNDAEASMMAERVRAAIDAYRSGMASDDASILGRRSRTSSEWIRSLRRMGTGAEADLRTPPIPNEFLWRVLEDASRPRDQRVAAAIALSDNIAPNERERIRIAAGTTVSPKLRVALEQVADGQVEEPAMEEALAELEAEDAAAPAKATT